MMRMGKSLQVRLLYGLAILWGLPMFVFDVFPYLKMTPIYSAYLLAGFFPFLIYLVYCFGLGVNAARNRMFKNEVNGQSVFRIKLGALALASFIASAKLSAWTGRQYPYKSWDLKFESGEWIKEKNHPTSDGQHISVRQKMIADLLENKIPGRTREEVSELLGDPDKGAAHWKADLVYHLGLERESWLRLDDEWLLIHFDSLQKVKSTYIHTD